MIEALRVIRDKVYHLAYAPRFGDDEINYAVLGSVNERAQEIIADLTKLIRTHDG